MVGPSLVGGRIECLISGTDQEIHVFERLGFVPSSQRRNTHGLVTYITSLSGTNDTMSGSTHADYVIVGSGVNGTSIASYLSTILPSSRICILDRSSDGFVSTDGASHDLNKIIRADYTDSNYCTLAKEAISRWRSHPVLSRFYHEVGVLFRSSDKGRIFGGSGSADEYVEAGIRHAWENKDAHLEVAPPGATLPPRAFKLDNDEKVQRIFRGVDQTRLGDGLKGMGKTQTGYFNPRGGWAEANNACRALLQHAIEKGVQVYSNALVTSLLMEEQKVVGVQTKDGRKFFAQHIILACGAWTSDLLTTLAQPLVSSNTSASLEKWMTRPSAQCVAILRLTDDEARALQNTPVVINFSSGFYQFEPVFKDGQWQLKIAYHSNGYLYPKPRQRESKRGYPRFEDSKLEHAAVAVESRELGAERIRSDDVGYNMAETTIPSDQVECMLSELSQIYPSIATKERVMQTRVCWYSDTLDENWILDTLNHHPAIGEHNAHVANNVWVVSGDSGHAYKFLPIIGELFATVKGLVDNKRHLDLSKFSFQHQHHLHTIKKHGASIQSADSNRFDPTKHHQPNHRARL